MIVDIIIILVFLSALLRGRELGLARQALSAIGFFGGLFIGAMIEPGIVSHSHTQLSRALVALAVIFGCAMICLTIGEYFGVYIKAHLRGYGLNKVDAILGAIAGGLTTLLTVWLLAPILLALPFPGLQTALRNSTIVSTINTNLPAAPNVISDLGHLIDPNGFPNVFNGLEPTPPSDVTLPNLGTMQTAVQKDRASVVKVEGTGCGGIVEGSGFVAGKGFVATNAHVVAGIANPFVLDGNGTHRATTVWFDPDLDLAVLRVGNLAGSVLPIDTGHKTKNTPGVVLGYPGGGKFSANPASVLDEFTATGRNIYDQGNTTRQVYEIKASIIPGNSGGPLIEQNGDVIGLVFAESTTYNQVGYALTTPQVANEINRAVTLNTPVSTGNCAE